MAKSQQSFSKKEKEYWMKCSLLGPGDESKLRDSTVFDEEFYEFLEFKMLDMLRAENFLILRILYDPHERISKEVFFNLLANIASSSKKAVDMFIDNPDKLGAQSISFTRNSELFDFYNVISSVINSKLKNEILFKRDLDALNIVTKTRLKELFPKTYNKFIIKLYYVFKFKNSGEMIIPE